MFLNVRTVNSVKRISVTRFKLIKSGKTVLRATSNFGLLKVSLGQVEETVVAEVREDAVSSEGKSDKPWLAQRDCGSWGCFFWCLLIANTS